MQNLNKYQHHGTAAGYHSRFQTFATVVTCHLKSGIQTLLPLCHSMSVSTPVDKLADLQREASPGRNVA